MTELKNYIEPWRDNAFEQRSPEERIEFNWCAWAYVYGTAPVQIACHSSPDCVRFYTGLPIGFLNLVFWSNFPPAETQKRVYKLTAEIRAEIAQKNCPSEWGIIDSLANKHELVLALEQQGWRFSYRAAGMRCQLERSTAETATPSLFSIVKVQTAAQVAGWLDPFMQGFSIKEECRGFMQDVFSSMATTVAHPFEHYVLFLHGAPIAIGSLHFKYGTAVIYNIATLTEYRKKGAASAMVQFLKTRALEAGYSEVFLFALESAQSTYQRLGFKSISAGYDIYALDT